MLSPFRHNERNFYTEITAVIKLIKSTETATFKVHTDIMDALNMEKYMVLVM